ncbi:MBL fold metallo-hydrolase [Pseudothauera rhizosphaerae]|uniref:MBL fold metallo-hydrolase n=1 Tax=Pseudothauera rhizosphaerae TaxID=2565932 RepID=A0A4S4AY83_9RHOO|nr:MBL fold metallo-hydrolase [Pseudothauera rhizosphaerae]THF65100.1 MBL fold metallo-hydrolase [Pseudothauera rhizosphaerae]
MTQATAPSPSAALAYPWADHPAPGSLRPVAPGVGWLRMPLPFALDHVNVWLLDDGEALAVVDTGFGLDEVRAHWEAVLAADGRPLKKVVVTHCHPDHLGLATWLAARDGASILMTQGEFLGGHALWHQLPGHCVTDMVEQFRRHGLDEARLQALAGRGNAYRRGVPDLPATYSRLFDGDQVRIGTYDWQVIVGYGHAPEHASLYCEALGILISGDMLLPRISTNVSVFAATPEDDPLGRFLDSLRRIRNLPDDTLVLPSHGRPFRGIRARVEQLVEHHRDRCAELLAACTTPRCAGELLGTLFPRELDTHQVMFAMGEAIAHLNHLAVRGELCRRVDGEGVIRFARNA